MGNSQIQRTSSLDHNEAGELTLLKRVSNTNSRKKCVFVFMFCFLKKHRFFMILDRNLIKLPMFSNFSVMFNPKLLSIASFSCSYS